MFSEALRILDRNTVQYMMDEMQAEIDSRTAQAFAYEVRGDSAVILRCFSRDSRAEIPERIGDYPVTELGSYAFSEHFDEEKLEREIQAGRVKLYVPEILKNSPALCGERLEEIVLPQTLRRVGRYCFYNCGSLRRIEFHGNLSDWGSGAFTGCHGMRSLRVYADADGRSYLKDVLDELREELEVEYFAEAVPGGRPAEHSERIADERMAMRYRKEILYGGWLTGPAESSESIVDERTNGAPGFALLIFPEFYEEGVENTPARILENHVHGSGILYRNCFRGRVLDFAQYDALFPHAKAWESKELVLRMTLARLRAPQGLGKKAREQYEAYLRENAAEAGRWLLGQRDLEGLRFLLALVDNCDKAAGDDVSEMRGMPEMLEMRERTEISEKPELFKMRERYEKTEMSGIGLVRTMLEEASRMQYMEVVSFLMEYERTNRRRHSSARRRLEL